MLVSSMVPPALKTLLARRCRSVWPFAQMKKRAWNSQVPTIALAGDSRAHVAAGERARAEAILQALERRAETGYVPATALAAVFNALGRTDAAPDQLERAHEEHDVRIAFLGIDARWNNLRDQPRFKALAARVGLAGGPASGRF